MKALIASFLTAMALLSVAPAAHAGSESFRQTCQVRYEDSNRIQADCLSISGNYVYNDYSPRYCAGDLANMDGYLTCSSGNSYPPVEPPPQNDQVPYGSYQLTCGSCYISGNLLRCSCEDTAGYWHNTYLNYRSCRSEIANLNGRLYCNQ
jgi:hypothetical protein